MTLFRTINDSVPLNSGNFAADFTANKKVKNLLNKIHGAKILPFEASRDMKDIKLLYPAWTARELGINQNIKSNLSRLHMLSAFPKNFITCMRNGEICFILGFDTPTEDEQEKTARMINVYMLSGKPLKRAWSHHFADLFSFWLACLAKTYRKYFIVASCDRFVDKYNKFTESFGFSFWGEYGFNNRPYNLYIFNEAV